MIAAKCDNNQPSWNAKFYAGHADSNGVRRCTLEDKDGNCLSYDVIECSSPEINKGAWVSYEDFVALQRDVLNKCKQWETLPEYLQ